MILILSIIPIALLIAWAVAERRCRTRTRIAVGLALVISSLVWGFLAGRFAEALSHMAFPVPHDAPDVEAGSTNVLTTNTQER
jgi:hypothetical protein